MIGNLTGNKITHRERNDGQMNDVSLKAIIEKFENLFSIFNKKFYNNELQTPVITVSLDTTRGAYGWCTSCGCIVRATKEVNIMCGDCDEYFEEEY